MKVLGGGDNNNNDNNNTNNNSSSIQLKLSDDFFQQGGTSLSAGQVISLLRSEFQLPLSGIFLFNYRSIKDAAMTIDNMLDKKKNNKKKNNNNEEKGEEEKGGGVGNNEDPDNDGLSDEERDAIKLSIKSSERSQSSFIAVFIQILPLFFFYPLTRIASVLVFMSNIVWLLKLYHWIYHHDANNSFIDYLLKQSSHIIYCVFLTSFIITRLILLIALPLIGILFKWIIIGRYKQGYYGLWSNYYLRWWLVEKLLEICNRGIFDYIGINYYYRLLGAKIGKNVIIHDTAILLEYDLITINDNTIIDQQATIRPYQFNYGGFSLRPIIIKNNCFISLKSIVTGGAILEDNNSIGIQSSSFNINNDPIITEQHRKSSKILIPSPSRWRRLLYGYPLIFLIKFISYSPFFILLFLMVKEKTRFLAKDQDMSIAGLRIFKWLTSPYRILFYCLIQISRWTIIRYLYLLLVIITKRLIIGKFTAGPISSSDQKKLMQYWLMNRLLGGGKLGGVARLVGTHYDGISFIYRLLGAKVGQRVYFPGSGLDIIEFDLLTIGNDVVFGSRSSFLPTDSIDAQPIILCSGSMIADRCIIRKGVIVGTNTIIGSGGVTSAGRYYNDNSIYIGNVNDDSVFIGTMQPEKIDMIINQKQEEKRIKNNLNILKKMKKELENEKKKKQKEEEKKQKEEEKKRKKENNNKDDDNNNNNKLNGQIKPSNGYHQLPSDDNNNNHKGMTQQVSDDYHLLIDNDNNNDHDIEANHHHPHNNNNNNNPSDDTNIIDIKQAIAYGYLDNLDTLRPFGKAFYLRQSNYTVLPLWFIIIFSNLWYIFLSIYHMSPLIGTWLIIEKIISKWGHHFNHPERLGIIITVYLIMFYFFYFGAFLFELGGKWLLLSRRMPGLYRWDQSSYCQRWQLYLLIQDLRRYHRIDLLDLIGGSIYIIAWFRLMGATIGKQVCLYPSGADPMMTEPDLVTIDNNACIDNASLVGHINTYGNFQLNHLSVGKGAILRAQTRLLSGAMIYDEGMLLEKTLVMSGDVVEKKQKWQGWPVQQMY